jgi:hypothetical protein
LVTNAIELTLLDLFGGTTKSDLYKDNPDSFFFLEEVIAKFMDLMVATAMRTSDLR